MRCASCASELIPGKPFCHVCGVPVAGTCASCGATLAGDFRFCPDCGAPTRADGATAAARKAAGATASESRPSTTPSAGSPASSHAADAADRLQGVPRHLPASLSGRLVAAPGGVAGERKRVTVLFCDLAGSTEMADGLDPEEFREILDQYVEVGMQEVYRYEGIVNQLAGDGIMALFGAPVAHEDAPERAVRAALAIRDAVAHLNATTLAERGVELRIRIGINTGPVIVGTVGNDLKMDYTATGDTTNLASRLQTLAPANSVLVSAATERLVRGRFEMRATGPLAVKGKRAPVVAYEVLDAIDDAGAFRLAEGRGLTRFIGRDEELAQLEACYQRLHGRLPQLVAIVGEAGSGKSRLIHELKQRLAPEQPAILEARCSSLSQMHAYAPWTNMLRHFFGVPLGTSEDESRHRVQRRLRELDPDLEPHASRIAGMFSVPGSLAGGTEETEDEKRATFGAVGDVVGRLTQQRPVVMIFEDLHWIDDPSREMLELAVGTMRNWRFMLIVSHRPEYEPHWRVGGAFTRLHLRPLGDEHAVEMIRAVAGGDLQAELEEMLCAKAEGNPFFLEELARTLVEDGSLEKSGGRVRLTRPVSEISVPETVQEVIGARIDRLSSSAKRTVQVAAVLGRQFRRDQLELLLAGESIAVAAELEELEHRGIVHRKTVLSEEEFRFGESVTQELAYDSLLGRERRALHGRIARLVEETAGESSAERSALLAHHFARSDERDKAIEALLRAAVDAERVPSYHAAREFYRAAWNMASQALTGSPDDTLRRHALSAAIGFCHMSVIYASTGETDEVERVARHGRELALQLDVKSAHASFPSYEGLAAISSGPDRFAHGLALVEEALDSARREGLAHNAVNISRGLAWTYLFDGRFREASELITRAQHELDPLESPGRPSDLWFGVRSMTASIQLHSDQMDAATATDLDLHGRARQHGNRTIAGSSASLLAQVHLLLGEYAEASRWAEVSLETAREIGNVAASRIASAVAIVARTELGLPVVAGRYVRHVETSIKGATSLPLFLHLIVDALLSIGEWKRAESVIEQTEHHTGGRLRAASWAA
ncbi:MAG: tetratricopeptide repeat protein, partial [Deltaproteobacteria bacterium]|nr:tetratricopeptide repeat protein [Deltaproteobacteria bacterium]